jgi:hypothetical protein
LAWAAVTIICFWGGVGSFGSWAVVATAKVTQDTISRKDLFIDFTFKQLIDAAKIP